MQPQQPQVFMSYSRVDEAFALWLMQMLESRGVNVWRDKEGIRAGNLWPWEISEAIKSCSHLLIILSPASVSSKNVLDELYCASDNRKHILPVLYHACEIPSLIQTNQYVDFREPSPYDPDYYKQPLEKLIQRFNQTQYLAAPPSRRSYVPARAAIKQLALSDDRWIAGVCGGLAEYWGTNALVVRITFIVVALVTSGFPV